MNFLAHIYLSGNDDLLKIGNFMADGIRGSDYKSLPEPVRKGVLLHREIDSFTDAHPVFRQSTKRLHARYHHYAGVIVDVLYDHFLAKNWQLYSNEPLAGFVSRFYDSLHANYELLTTKTKQMLPIMVQRNWLLSYQTVDGIGKILTQMDHRTANKSLMRFSTDELVAFYTEFESEFTAFFTDVRAFVATKIELL